MDSVPGKGWVYGCLLSKQKAIPKHFPWISAPALTYHVLSFIRWDRLSRRPFCHVTTPPYMQWMVALVTETKYFSWENEGTRTIPNFSDKHGFLMILQWPTTVVMTPIVKQQEVHLKLNKVFPSCVQNHQNFRLWKLLEMNYFFNSRISEYSSWVHCCCICPISR